MYKRVIQFINDNKLIEKKDKILIGFSGGPDSVALAKILINISKFFDLEIALCHINHSLRGEESDGDEEFCKNFSIKNGLNFYSLKADITGYSKENSIGLEEAGREIRYEYFHQVAKDNSYNKIALAHNLDDNVETFLFRLMRGTGLHGLKGIPVQRDSIIRPLLFLKKSEILSFLEETNEDFRIDSSNNHNVYTRNKIRLDLIPYIEKEFNPKFKEGVSSLIQEISSQNLVTHKFTDIDSFLTMSTTEKRQILYSLLKEKEISISRKKIDDIISVLDKDGYKEFSLGNGYLLKKSYNFIKIVKEEVKNSKNDKIALDIPCKISYNGYTIETKFVSEVEKKLNHFYFNYNDLETPIYVRTKQDGDKFLPIGMSSFKKVKKFFIDEKIEKEKRDTIPIITAGEEILLIGNLRQSSLGILAAQNNKILLVKVEEGVFNER